MKGIVSLPLALLAGGGAALVPLGLGVWLGARHGGLAGRTRALWHGAAAGALLFLLLDFFNLSGGLGMGLTQWSFRAMLVVFFLLGIWLPARLEGAGEPRAVIVGPARTALLWAVGIGCHGLGEGIIMGYNLTLGWGVALAPLPLLSFGLHKLVEGVTAGLLLSAAAGPPTRAGVVAVAALPTAIGVLAGVAGLPGTLSNAAYALGAGATLFVLPKFLAAADDRDWSTSRTAGLILGFASMYLAALLHEL